MKYWKLTNTHNDNVPVSVITSSTTSKGLLLKPGQFCICMPQITSTMDAQVRKRLLSIDKDYDNTQGLPIGECLSVAEFQSK